jgi:hypothetical protein
LAGVALTSDGAVISTAAAAATAKPIFIIWDCLLGLDTATQRAGTWKVPPLPKFGSDGR